MAAARYILAVQGKPTDILTTRTRLPPEDMKEMSEAATKYVDIHPKDKWIDPFYMMIGSTDKPLQAAAARYPHITCRTEGAGNHSTVLSMQTMDLMLEFIDMMGAQNFRILNTLHRQAEDQAKVQADAGQARIQQHPDAAV